MTAAAADPAELKKLVKQLSVSGSGGGSSSQGILGVLETLKTDFRVNEAILRESKAGLAVGKLRAHQDKAVAEAAKDLVKKWKEEVERAKKAAGGAGATPNGSTLSRKDSIPGTPRTPTITAAGGSATLSGVPADARTAKSDGVNTDVTGEKTRDKCLQLVYDAICFDSTAPVKQILERAQKIEANVHAENGHSTGQNYTTRMRQLFVNLKDKKNPTLRQNVVDGELSVDEFTKMSVQDMASAERKAANKKIEDQVLFQTLGAGEIEAETDAFECGRCKQRKCRYRQAQTRSADEPMTTFVTCTNCGNKWKFS